MRIRNKTIQNIQNLREKKHTQNNLQYPMDNVV